MKFYLVGGAVRDMIMGIEPKDRDWVVTGATEQDMLRLGFEKVGASFPVFLHPETGEEYALARRERKVDLGYHGFEVDTHDVTIEEDLMRRDLTINSIALDPDTEKFIDPAGGINDINDRILRHTSEAFADDPLRVIRLARFAARFPDFRISPKTLTLCRLIVTSKELETLPNERFFLETEKALECKSPFHFFKTLEIIDPEGVCSFYKKLLTNNSVNFGVFPFGYIQALPKDERLETFVATLDDSQIFPTYDSKLMAQCVKTLRAGFTAESLFEVCKLTRVEHGLYIFHKFMNVFTLAFPEKVGLMARTAVLFASVKSHDFPNLTGKELGDAIKQARMDKLTKATDT